MGSSLKDLWEERRSCLVLLGDGETERGMWSAPKEIQIPDILEEEFLIFTESFKRKGPLSEAGAPND